MRETSCACLFVSALKIIFHWKLDHWFLTINRSENLQKHLLRTILVNTCFRKVTNPQPATLFKKWAPLQHILSAFIRYCTFSILHFTFCILVMSKILFWIILFFLTNWVTLYPSILCTALRDKIFPKLQYDFFLSYCYQSCCSVVCCLYFC